jgi:hypothetical protein
MRALAYVALECPRSYLTDQVITRKGGVPEPPCTADDRHRGFSYIIARKKKYIYIYIYTITNHKQSYKKSTYFLSHNGLWK